MPEESLPYAGPLTAVSPLNMPSVSNQFVHMFPIISLGPHLERRPQGGGLTIGEVDQVQTAGAGGLLEFLQPYLNSPVCMSPGRQRQVRMLQTNADTKVIVPMEHDPLCCSCDAVMTLIESR